MVARAVRYVALAVEAQHSAVSVNDSHGVVVRIVGPLIEADRQHYLQLPGQSAESAVSNSDRPHLISTCWTLQPPFLLIGGAELNGATAEEASLKEKLSGWVQRAAAPAWRKRGTETVEYSLDDCQVVLE